MKKHSFDPSLHIDFEWKSRGVDFLTLMPSTFTDLDFLRTQDFEELVDELAMESPNICFEPLAQYLEGYNYQLWELDFLDDNCYLAIVPESKKAVFTEYWEPECTPLLIKAPREKIAKKMPSQKLNLTVDSYRLYSWSEITSLSFDCPLAFVAQTDDEDNEYAELTNFSTWPPRAEKVSGIEPKELALWSPFAQVNGRDIWKQEVDFNIKRRDCYFQFSEVIATDPWSFVPLSSKLTESLGESVVMEGFFLHISQQVSGKKTFHEITAVYSDRQEVWLRSTQNFKLVPFDNGKDVLVIHLANKVQYSVANGPLTLGDLKDFPLRPHNYGRNVFLIHDQEMIFFNEISKRHVNDSSLRENRLQLCRLNLKNGALRKFPLNGFWTEQKILADNFEDDFLLKSFDGFVDVCKGPECWWIFNHVTNSTGKTDPAWIWNSITDEVLKIQSIDFPRESPRFMYVAALQRYIASVNGSIILLREDLLDTLRQRKNDRLESASV